HNALGLRFAKVNYTVAGSNVASPDLEKTQMNTEIAALNEYDRVLNAMWQKWAVSPQNRTATGQPIHSDARAFANFILQSTGKAHPLDLLNEKINLLMAAGLEPDSSVTVDAIPRQSRGRAI